MESNLIYCGDNLEVLAKFPEKSIDLIYADPPFFSNKQYEIIWGNGAEMKVYEDRWKGGINVYIEWMEERLWQCYRILKDTGSMYLHCDWHANAHLRILMDRIFDGSNFQNEIIWHYRRWTAVAKKFQKLHDTILFYTKTDNYTFNPTFEPYGDWIKKDYGYTDENGQRWRWHTVKGNRYKVYLDDEGKGVKLGDVWQIPYIGSTAKERLGYPTQKPEALLKRIIEGSSSKDDLVLDPFAGGGTTLVVAHQLGRKWIGIDVSPIACDKMRDRLSKTSLGIGTSDICIIGAPQTIDELKALEPFQFQNWVIARIGGHSSKKKSADMGIDGYTFMAREPIQVKQSEGIGRNVIDNFETAIRREHKSSGYIVAFNFAKSAYEEAARAKAEDKMDIKLVRVDEMDGYFTTLK